MKIRFIAATSFLVFALGIGNVFAEPYLSVVPGTTVSTQYRNVDDYGYWRDADVSAIASDGTLPGGGLQTSLLALGHSRASGNEYEPWTYWALASGEYDLFYSADLVLNGTAGETANVIVDYNHSLFYSIINDAGSASILWNSPVFSGAESDLKITTALNGTGTGYVDSPLEKKVETYFAFDTEADTLTDQNSFFAGTMTVGDTLSIAEAIHFETGAGVAVGGSCSAIGFANYNVSFSLSNVVLPGYVDPPSQNPLPLLPTPTPEPATVLLFGTGILGLAGTRIRRKKA